MALSVKRTLPLVAVLTLLAVAAPAPVSADTGWLTPEAPFVTLDPGVPAGSTVKAIISSGETLNGFMFEGLPDGIGIAPGPGETANVFVAHEQTTVPFFGTRMNLPCQSSPGWISR